MRPAALLARAHALGITVEVEGEALAVSAERSPPSDLLAQLRTHKAALVAHLKADLMPPGAGRCTHCGRWGWLPAGPVDVRCEQCEVDRILARAAMAVDPRHADDPAEVTLRGELP